MPRLYKTQGIVLKSIALSEGHLSVTILDNCGSKFRAMAWGGCKLTSRKLGHLEPLTVVDLELSEARDLRSVRQAQSVESFGKLKVNLEATAKAFYVTELVDGFANEDGPNPPLYELFCDTLRGIQRMPDSFSVILYFQLKLLRVCGFMPELYKCVECGELASQSTKQFAVNLGGLLCQHCEVPRSVRIIKISIQAIKVLRFLDSVNGSLDARPTLSSDLYNELRSILDGSISQWLDRDVQSQAFMDHLGHMNTVQLA